MCAELQAVNLMDILRQQNKEFRSLEEKHKQYEAELDEFNKHVHLTPDQDILRQVLKKKKLLIKDKMAEIIKEFSTSTASIRKDGQEKGHS